MVCLIRSIRAAGLAVALVLAPMAARAGDAGTGGPAPALQSTMNRVFGPGRWRPTSGYRTRAREDQLRREGAGTVPPGRISRHSLGSPAAPGAYDAVVFGVPPRQAAAMLRRADAGAFRVLAEGPHGAQGPHLHIEPTGARAAAPPTRTTVACASIRLRIIGGRRNPQLASCTDASGE
ncbi:MAG: hypothetical protein P4L73_01440 [Caulobacteraceae bacterium]|nr:hypothetical protein [Caulobacteraceae bacterium]